MQSNEKNSDNDNNIVLLNTFVINNKKFRVFLHSNLIIWEKENSSNEKTILNVSDIINVCTKKITSTITGTISDTNNSKSLIIHYAKKKQKSNSINKWRHHTIIFTNSETRIIQLWKDSIQNLMKEQQYRPKQLLLFINPFGGKKQAMKIFEKYAKPLFKIANIDVNVVVSQRAYQIRDFILTQSLNNYDGIVCVGGDGTFSEVFNGIVLRTMTDLDLNIQNPKYYPDTKIPIGIIPGGSTDTVAFCIHGTNDIITSIIHITLGITGGMDLSSVSNGSSLLRFYASCMSYGYIGDILLDSEKFRWMGPRRYEYSGLKKLLRNRGYEGEISFVLEENSNPTDGENCIENCIRCFNKKQLKTNDNVDENNKQNENDNENYSHDLLKWKTIKGKFYIVNGSNLSCACSRSPRGLSPYCHIGDGCIDLILVRHTSIINNIKLLLKSASSSGTLADLPFVEVYRTKKFCFRTPQIQNSNNSSLSNSTQPLRFGQDVTSSWNCDGEIIMDTNIMIRGHCQLVKVFRRGIKGQDETSGCCGRN